MTRETAKQLIEEIFERIKKWYTLTMKSIKLMFRNRDTKRKHFVNQRDLNRVLNLVCKPFKVTSQHVNAIMRVFGNVEQDQLVYEKFCSIYFRYALRN